MLASMKEGKRDKTIAAFKVSTELHAQIAALAERHDRNIANQVIHLLKKGLEAESGREDLEARLREIEARLGLATSRGKPPRQSNG